MDKLTLVFGYRNREPERVKRCLDSLALQSNMHFSVVFVDYGSDSHIAGSVEKLVTSYPFCKYVYSDTRGWPWNRSHALNTGIQLAETEYVVTTDIDLIYSKGFIDKVLSSLDPAIELHATAYALPENFSNWSKLKDGVKLNVSERPLTALGMVQGVLSENLRKIGGFDEHFRIWGAEDQDLSSRLSALGVKQSWLDLPSTPVYHQWHPSTGFRTRSAIPQGWQKMMIHYLEDKKDQIERNSTWGAIVNKEQRPTLSLLQEKEKLLQLDLTEVPVHGASFLTIDQFGKLPDREALLIKVDGQRETTIKGSPLNKWIERFNKFSNDKNWPLLLLNDMEYFGNYHSIYQYRDMLMYFLLQFEDKITDYHFSMEESQIQLLLLK